jgi:hypothetical protein
MSESAMYVTLKGVVGAIVAALGFLTVPIIAAVLAGQPPQTNLSGVTQSMITNLLPVMIQLVPIIVLMNMMFSVFTAPFMPIIEMYGRR